MLAEERSTVGLSQEFIAGQMQLDQTILSKIENGRRTLTLREFLKWAEVMSLPDDAVRMILQKMKNYV